MKNTRFLRTGIIGAAIVALCCFTPVLVLLLGVLGLSALTGYLDYVLFPALAFFIGLTFYALSRKRSCDNADESGNSCDISEDTK